MVRFAVVSLRVKDKNYLDGTIAEEVFHSGQAIFYGRKDASNNKGNIILNSVAIETEAKVYKAFSGTYNQNSEGYIHLFAHNKSVKKYFSALRSGNDELIKKTEVAYKLQLVKLAKDVAELYGKNEKELNDFVKNGVETIFYKLTKKDKLKK